MKGATPTGPKVVIPSRATASTPTWTTERCREKSGLQPLHPDVGHELGNHRPDDNEHQEGSDQRGGLSPSRDGPPQDGERVREPAGVEEHPAQADELEGQEPLHPYAHGTVGDGRQPPLHPAPAADVAHRLPDAVQRPPEHEGPRRPVPQTSEHHGDHDVADRLRLGSAAPAERDVEVVAQPP